MRGWLVAIIAIAGCGRANFDLLPGSGGSDGPTDGHPLDLVFMDTPAGSLVTFIQTAGNANGVNLSDSVTLPMPVTAGNLLIVQIDYDATTVTATGVTDTRADSYTVTGPNDGNGVRQYIAHTIVASTGMVTVTVTLSGLPTSFFEVRLFEYSGIRQTNPLILTSGGGGTSTSTDGAFTIVTATPGDLIFGTCIFSTVGGTGTAGTGFTTRSMFANDVAEDRIATTSGVTNVTATMTVGSKWAILGAAFHHQ